MQKYAKLCNYQSKLCKNIVIYIFITKNKFTKLKKCIEKISVLVRRSGAEASGNTPTELPLYWSVKESSEPPRASRVISRGSIQKNRISDKIANWRRVRDSNPRRF